MNRGPLTVHKYHLRRKKHFLHKPYLFLCSKVYIKPKKTDNKNWIFITLLSNVQWKQSDWGLRVTKNAYFSLMTHTKQLLFVTFCYTTAGIEVRFRTDGGQTDRRMEDGGRTDGRGSRNSYLDVLTAQVHPRCTNALNCFGPTLGSDHGVLKLNIRTSALPRQEQSDLASGTMTMWF